MAHRESPRYTVGVLTVSDTAARDASADASGPVLRTILERDSDAYRIVVYDIVPDDPVRIRDTVQKWCDELHIALVITTGGTGMGVRDGTPEALAPLIHKPTPGLTHALTAYSLTKTPLAALARSASGIRQRAGHGGPGSLIVALPGSVKAVKENMEILLSLLPHALELIGGGDGRETHAGMGSKHVAKHIHAQAIDTGTDTGHAHHKHAHSRSHGHHAHGHGHHAPKPRTYQSEDYVTHDPAGAPTTRHRNSPYPILPLSDALALIAQHTFSPSSSSRSASSVRPPTRRAVDASLAGYVLAEDVHALADMPPRPTTNVDGYAVRANDTAPGAYSVLTLRSLPAAQTLPKGSVFRINTGQPLPLGADAVVMVEDTRLLERRSEQSSALSSAGGEEEARIEILAQVDPKENVRAAGSDLTEGQLVLRKGTPISPLGGEVGTLAFVGRKDVLVYPKPRVALLSTGNELRDISSSSNTSTGPQDEFAVFDANRPGLRAAVEGLGFEVVDLGIVGDDIDATLTALRRGLNEADIVLSTGGTSMGESDLLKPLLERELHGQIHFGRVAMKPGKPTTFATVSDTAASPKLVFALPGNPASALVCFYVFVLPALRKLAGYAPTFICSRGPSNTGATTASGTGAGAAETQTDSWSLPRVSVKLAQTVKLDPRPEFHRVVVRVQQGEAGTPASLVAYSTGSQRSSGMHSMATANALLCLPALVSGGPAQCKEGEMVDAILLGPLV